jgi:hypothetical protein
MKFFEIIRKVVRRITENSSLIKTIVIGRNVSFAALNQINEKDQKIIDKTTAQYVLTLLFNTLSFVFLTDLKRGEFNFNISNFCTVAEKTYPV